MNINRDNYEAWFLDYLDGNLDGNLDGEFREFLRLNPDLQEELQEYDPVCLEKEGFSFPRKEILYRDPLDKTDHFNRMAVSWMEGDLDAGEEEILKNYMEHHPEKRELLELFQKTRLTADPEIVCPDRKKLYHHFSGRILYAWTTRIAAAALLVWGIYSVWEKRTVPSQAPDLAEIVTPAVTQQDLPSFPETATLMETERNTSGKRAAIQTGQSKLSRLASYRDDLTTPDGKTETQPVFARTRMEAPALMPSLPVTLASRQVRITLAAVQPESYPPAVADNQELTLGEWFMNKAGRTFSKVLKSGLDLAGDLAQDKVSFDTNDTGEITALNLETRLVGLTIPFRKE